MKPCTFEVDLHASHLLRWRCCELQHRYHNGMLQAKSNAEALLKNTAGSTMVPYIVLSSQDDKATITELTHPTSTGCVLLFLFSLGIHRGFVWCCSLLVLWNVPGAF